MLSIDKELLIARLNYLDETNKKPGLAPIDPIVSRKVRELIDSGEITSYMALESVYNYIVEKLQEDKTQIDKYAREIISFIV